MTDMTRFEALIAGEGGVNDFCPFCRCRVSKWHQHWGPRFKWKYGQRAYVMNGKVFEVSDLREALIAEADK